MKLAACAFALLFMPAAAFADDSARFVGKSDCRVARPALGPDESVTWAGPCKDGYAEGPGVLQRALKVGLFDKPGPRYEVTMARGQISGEGSVTYPNGDTYFGSLLDGKRHGKGYAAFADGHQYEGQYQNDVPHGTGTLLDKDRSKYVGEWKDGKFDGVGARTWALGGSYDGEWKAGKFHGKGVLVYAGSGRRREALFEDGRLRGTPAPAKERGVVEFEPYLATPPKSVKETLTPLSIPATGFSPEQRATLKSAYMALEEGDEPPYPLSGEAEIYAWITKAQGELMLWGEMRLDVLVGKDGNALSVRVIGTPHPDMAKFAVALVGKEKYKSAVCRGEPCEMIYPFSMKFAVSDPR